MLPLSGRGSIRLWARIVALGRVRRCAMRACGAMLDLQRCRQHGRPEMTLIKNETKRKLKAGEMALGFGVHPMRTGALGMLGAATGHDWIFIDMEHGAFSVQEASQICIASLTAGVTPIVRVCADAIDEGTRALDN